MKIGKLTKHFTDRACKHNKNLVFPKNNRKMHIQKRKRKTFNDTTCFILMKNSYLITTNL